jgi:hypothetical protein
LRDEQINLLTEMAQECFAAARWVPSEAELGWEYLAQRDALLANQSASETSSEKSEPPQRRRQRRPRIARPDGLRTAAEAAARLGCSIKTLNGHVASGALRYVAIGHGRKRPRKMFADADLTAFIEAQTRKDSPCPSDATRGPRSGNTISKSEIIAFSEVQKRPRGAKPKP